MEVSDRPGCVIRILAIAIPLFNDVEDDVSGVHHSGCAYLEEVRLEQCSDRPTISSRREAMEDRFQGRQFSVYLDIAAHDFILAGSGSADTVDLLRLFTQLTDEGAPPT
nr:hypothetical protein [Gordonia terrae]